jgi:sortase A
MSEPLNSHIPEETPAMRLVRSKVASAYENEPNVQEEIKEAEASKTPKSKHQQFMYALSHSGKSLAEIQTAWHNYYVHLPDNEKHEVWQEFYAQHKQGSNHTVQHNSKHQSHQVHHETTPATMHDIKASILKKTPAKKQLTRRQNLKSILFGLSVGTITMVILLFSFFNERFIAPFITPSRTVSSTPIIIDPSSTGVTAEPKLIIPKINLEVPVVYDVQSIEEKAIQTGLENGVVHYSTTPVPGQQGNVAIVGHSSNNLLNKGRYKFAFVLLKNLEVGDTFYLNYQSKRYVYKVYDKKIVKPTEIGVLSTQERASTATLITCDPPGTAANRLVVVAEQITPDPSKNSPSSVNATAAAPNTVPGNAPTLWSRIYDFFVR